LACLRIRSVFNLQQQYFGVAYYLDDRADLAAREGITPNALRLRVFKAKQKLRACIACCLRCPHR
jgi:hypothetical protein